MKAILPPNITDKMDARDRRSLGVRTPEEDSSRWNDKAERKLHEQIFALLRRRDIPYIHAPMFKRSTLPAGMPDFLFAFKGLPIAWECKVGKNIPTPEQRQMMSRLDTCGWITFVVRSLEYAQEILDEIDSKS